MSLADAPKNNALDGIAIAGSFLCMAHCLALPVLIALLPAWSSWLVLPESFHLWFLLAALPFSSVVLARAARRAGTRAPLALGIAGLILMTFAVALLGNPVEPWVTSLGALLLASGHILNWRGRPPCHG